jgi:hypothetical protein
MKSHLCGKGRLSLLLLLALVTAAVLAVPASTAFAAPESNVLVLYKDLDRDGKFESSRTYLVDPAVAIAAYKRDPASKVGTSKMFETTEVSGGASTTALLGSADSFESFLATHYKSFGSDQVTGVCVPAISWECPYATPGCGPTNCTPRKVWVECLGTCTLPVQKCLRTAAGFLVTGWDPGSDPCVCATPNQCARNTEAIPLYMAGPPLCLCKNLPVPAMSVYGLIILALLLAGTAVWVVRRRSALIGTV